MYCRNDAELIATTCGNGKGSGLCKKSIKEEGQAHNASKAAENLNGVRGKRQRHW
jgi:hypothetical protein